MFTLHRSTSIGRRGTLVTEHGTIETPFFMPVGTSGAMRGITHEELRSLGAQILLCNTYHLFLQPGEKIVEDAGGLHQFIGWDKPILTDSGGYQVFSFGKRGHTYVDDTGVEFQSHISGEKLFIGPADSIRIQHALGSDIIMVFDECPPSTSARSEIERAVDRTLRWAQICKQEHEILCQRRSPTRPKTPKNQRRKTYTAMNSISSDSSASSASSASSVSRPLLFGIIQGGLERDLREKCAQELIAMGFDGYALGGLAVGESPADLLDVLDAICPLLPADKPRYLMGVGTREQLKTCVAKGIDMFDCVLPMRLARHGTLLHSDGSELHMHNAAYREAHEPIDPDSPSPLSRTHLRSYLHHLFKGNERLAETIACMQNLGVTLATMKQLQKQISDEIDN